LSKKKHKNNTSYLYFGSLKHEGEKMKKMLAKSLSVMALLMSTTLVHAADTIKVGVLHSLSGTMAISETTLKDTVLMLIEEQNKKGGVLGKKT
jgi:urea transport system substrate-binding protein